MTVRQDEVDLNEVALAAQRMLSLQIAGRGLTTHLRLSAEPVIVVGDQALLERAAVNLWSNAIKFTPDGGTVTIGTARDPHHGRIVVTDTGIGIAPDDQEHVFSHFYRTPEAARRAIQGPGLGLGVVKTIADHHGATIELTSVPGNGTTIILTVPAP